MKPTRQIVLAIGGRSTLFPPMFACSSGAVLSRAVPCLGVAMCGADWDSVEGERADVRLERWHAAVDRNTLDGSSAPVCGRWPVTCDEGPWTDRLRFRLPG